jgi:DNA repair protein RecO (recombination protein O)
VFIPERRADRDGISRVGGDNGRVPLYRDEGVVLRTQKLGEADRIVTVFTRREGKVRAVAKGVRRTKSKFGARLEPTMRVDLQCYLGRELDIVTQAEMLDSFPSLMSDYGRYTIATTMLEVTDRLTAEREAVLRLYLLLVGGLRALESAEHDPAMVLDAFLLRALSVSGYEPSLEDCARCGAPGPHRAFAISAGGVVCPTCRPSGSASPSALALVLLADLLAGRWEGADSSERRTRREASGLVSAYTEWHLERRLRSLPMVERA